MTDQVAEGTFQWINGDQPSFTYWKDGEPSNSYSSPGEDCVMLLREFNMRWNDARCDDAKAGYICESKIYYIN